MKRLFFVLLLLAVLPELCPAQLIPEWIQIYGDEPYSTRWIRDHALLPDGGFIIAGSAYDTVASSDELLMWTDESGNILREELYDLDSLSRFEKLLVLPPYYPENDYSILVYVPGYNNVNLFQLFRIDQQGAIIWSITIESENNDFNWISDMCVRSDGVILCCGYYDSDNYRDAWLLGVTLDGQVIADLHYTGGHGYEDVFNGIELYNDGLTALLVGHTNYASWDSYGWLVKLSPDGTVLNELDYYQWLHPQVDVLDVCNNGDDTFFTVGYGYVLDNYGNRDNYYGYRQFDADLNLILEKEMLRTFTSYTPDMYILSTPSGFTTSIYDNGGTSWVMKYGYDGVRLWIRQYAGQEITSLNYRDEHYYFGGYTDDNDYWIAKTNDGPSRFWITPQDNLSIPAEGGWIDFTANLENQDAPFYADMRVQVAYLDESYGVETMFQEDVGVPHGLQIVQLEQYIPASAPAGNYRITMLIGDDPWNPDYHHDLDFEKLGEVRTVSAFDDAGLWPVVAPWHQEPISEEPTDFRPDLETVEAVTISPNPFNASTSLRVHLRESGDLNVDIYNISGRLVTALTAQRYVQGEHTLTIDGSSMASGIYFVHVQVNNRRAEVRKIVLMK